MNEPHLPALEPFHAMEILARARALEADGRSICHMELGEPAAPPAPAVLEAVARALPAGQPYTAAKGLPSLRRALADYYRGQHAVTVEPEQIVVTMGSSAAFILAFLAAVGKDSTVAVTRPAYPAYLNTLSGLGLNVVEIELSAADGWRLSAEAVEASFTRHPFDALLFASPANPTGAAVTRDGLGEIVATCRRLGIQLISDEIYHGLDYRAPSVSALEFGADPIAINSFSKYYCMTGWRIGWMVVPEHLLRRVDILQQNLFISAPTLSQVAGEVALGERTYSETQKARYAVNRDILSRGLGALGFGATAPADGAFYAYVDASPLTNDTMAFCKQLLEVAGVAATPGVDFDRRNGGHYIRFSYAGARETVERALDSMDRFIKRPSCGPLP